MTQNEQNKRTTNKTNRPAPKTKKNALNRFPTRLSDKLIPFWMIPYPPPPGYCPSESGSSLSGSLRTPRLVRRAPVYFSRRLVLVSTPVSYLQRPIPTPTPRGYRVLPSRNMQTASHITRVAVLALISFYQVLPSLSLVVLDKIISNRSSARSIILPSFTEFFFTTSKSAITWF